MTIFRNSILSETSSYLLSLTKIPHDEILEGFYKLRIRQSEKLKTALELYDLETHQKKTGPDYQRLKTIVKRSIEQENRIKNFGQEVEILRRTLWSRIREQNSVYKEFFGDCRQWETNGQCVKGDNCSFRDDINKRAKMTQPNPSPSSFMRKNTRKTIEDPKSQM